jgi:hypothetical protein
MIQIQGIDGPQTISRIELTEIMIARYEEILGQFAKSWNVMARFMVCIMVWCYW